MRRFLAARAGWFAACVLMVLTVIVRPAGAQTWNDPRSRSLVEGATQRRAEQLADTALRDYQAVAHGYVAFLAQLGEGLRTPPKVIKTDELENEVYWKAPNLSKQHIIGRRDTLLLPTDIAYHTDHLGIVQNNFPAIIRIGDGGDEVADVPHPLSPVGLREYDFALSDSFSIRLGAERINVYEVKVRPKDDRQPRVVGAVYIDQASNQVVRMNLTFTRAAFLDKALEDLSLVLENRLVAGRFWLPSRQEIEIRRKGEWLDYPARGIIRGRWEIGDYHINQSLAPVIFTGPEITIAPASVLATHKWSGNILDSLPPDVRAISEPDIQRVKDEARELVRAQSLAAASSATLSGRRVDDFARFNRVEGLSLGAGAQKQFGKGWAASVRARYGLDDAQGKGTFEIAKVNADASGFRVFGTRDFRELGDVAERSGAVNSLAAQEFGSDYTDPYLVRAVGARYDFATWNGFDFRATGTYESESPLGIHAKPVAGQFEQTMDVEDRHATRFALEVSRPPTLWIAGTELTLRAEGRIRNPYEADGFHPASDTRSLRGFVSVGIERPFANMRLATNATAAGVTVANDDWGFVPTPELVYLGGPVSAPGYDYHSLVSTSGYTGHVELRMPAPFPGFSLGRYGRVPSRATIAPYVHIAGIGEWPMICVPAITAGSGAASSVTIPRPGCQIGAHVFPAFGAAYVLPFDLLRVDVAKGVGRTGRWTFNIDVSRDFWSIL